MRHFNTNDSAAAPHLAAVVPVNSSAGFPKTFHYGYLARLLDDTDLRAIPNPAIRAATRAAHSEAYWKALRLLQRDVDRIRINRRRLMDARGEWKFESLIAESVRMSRLIWTLRIAGAAHAVHVPFLVSTVQETCSELSRLMAAPAYRSPAATAA